MGTADALVREALKHDNTLERAGNHTEFGREFGWDGVAWCHIFVSIMAKHSGNAGLIPHTASCWFGMDWFDSRGQFFRRGKKTPRKGDVVYYGVNGSEHVGIVVSVSDGKIHTIEGNTSRADGYNPNGGGVHRKTWPLTYSRIFGYGRPKYSEDDEVTPADIEKIAKLTAEMVWQRDGMIDAPPWAAKAGNESWTGGSYAHWGYRGIAEIKDKLDALIKTVESRPAGGDVDVAPIVAELRKEIAAVTVHLEPGQ